MQDDFRLMQIKTPVIQIPDENNSIYVKRDDLLPFSFGGNKVRIALEFINDMKKQGKDCILGYGNARSNLSRALANLCYQFKIPCHIISPADEDGTRIDTYNSKMVLSCDAKFHYCKKTNVKETVENVIEDLRRKGFNPYYIYGDSTGKGNEHTPMLAYTKVYEEIKNQYDYIFLATGTGMTQGGLLAGKAINNGTEKIVGISVARSSSQETEVLRRSLECFSNRIQKIGNCEINVEDAYLCDGYGTYNRQIEKTIHQQLIYNGMPLDPTYTGKAFWGMQDYIKKNSITGKKILFIHTGGTPLFFDYMKGIQLREVSSNSAVEEAVNRLEGMLDPSLTERNINLLQYAAKLSTYGKVWCHYDMEKPISIIAGYFNDMTSKTAYLSMLAVEKEYQGKKLASSLLSEFEDYAVKNGMEYVKLEVRRYNQAAQNLYKKFGYEVVDEASDTSFYMKKQLKNIAGGGELYNFLKKVERLFPVPLSEREQLAVLASKFKEHGTVSYVCENGKIIALCAGYTNDQRQRMGYISVVASLPEYTNKGYGKVAVQNFIEEAKNAGMKAIHLYADKENESALNMYEKLGFVDWIVQNEPRPEDKHLIKWFS